MLHIIKSGNFDCVEEILKVDINVNVTDKDGYTALMAAVEYPNATIVTLLLSKGAEVNAKNDDGKTALYLGVTRSQAEFQAEKYEASSKFSIYTKTVYTLLQAGANVDNIDKSDADFSTGTVHLNPTTLMKSNDIVQILMAAGVELKGTRLFEWGDNLQDLARKSIRNHLKHISPARNLYTTIPQLGLPRRIQAYMLYYTQQEVKTDLTEEERDLMYRTTNGDTDSVLSLIQAGVDVNIQDERGMTPLMLACRAGHVDLVVKLIETGANMNIQGYSGDTALIYATKKSQINCIQKLIEFGANLNIQGGDGETALMHAVDNENGNCLETLIDAGANLHIFVVISVNFVSVKMSR